jgi:hypothetical protein
MKSQLREQPFKGPKLHANSQFVNHGYGPSNVCAGRLIKTTMRRYRRQALFGLVLSLVFPSAFAQGWINFLNSPVTLFSVRNSNGTEIGLNGTYYFSLLTAPVGTSDPAQFVFNGVYATNQPVAGRFFGGSFLAVPNWGIGSSKSYLIAGWSASLGFTWNPAWLDGVFSSSGYFGMSPIGTGVAGGIFDTNKPPIPPLNLFGGTGIQAGFSLYPVDVPEPPSAAIATLGAGLLFFWSRRVLTAKSGSQGQSESCPHSLYCPWDSAARERDWRWLVPSPNRRRSP